MSRSQNFTQYVRDGTGRKGSEKLADSVRGATTETHGCHGRIRGGSSAGTTTVPTSNDIVRRHRLSRSAKKTAWATLEEGIPTGPNLQDDTPVKLYKLVNCVKRLAFFLTSGSNLHNIQYVAMADTR